MDSCDVFLSYASQDRDAAGRLAHALEAEGFSVWWDHHLASGDDYGRMIEERIAAAKAMVTLWSKDAAVSRWVRAEAQKGEGKLCPVRIDDADPPAPYNTLHTIGLSAWRGDREAPAFRRLVADVQARIDGRAPAAPPTRAKSPDPAKIVAWIAVPAALLGLSLVALQNVAAICQATGAFCPQVAVLGAPKPVAPAAPAEPVASPSEAPLPAPVTAKPPAPIPAQADTKLPPFCTKARPELAAALAEFAPAAGRARVRICRAGGDCSPGPVKLGTPIHFEIESDAPGRAIVIDLDEKGNDERLIPNDFASGREARVGPGRTLRIPDAGADFQTVAQEAEKGCILVMVAPEGGAAARAIVNEVAPTRGFGNVPAANVTRYAKEAHAGDAAMAGWAFGFAAYEVVE